MSNYPQADLNGLLYRQHKKQHSLPTGVIIDACAFAQTPVFNLLDNKNAPRLDAMKPQWFAAEYVRDSEFFPYAVSDFQCSPCGHMV